jgi:hypothetical protein
MSADLRQELKFDPIIETLLEKTKEGKLRWQETAEEGTYLAAVKGQRTFAISLDWNATSGPIRLVVRDVEGKAFLDARFSYANPIARELYDLAGRIALNLDEKVDETLQVLSQL